MHIFINVASHGNLHMNLETTFLNLNVNYINLCNNKVEIVVVVVVDDIDPHLKIATYQTFVPFECIFCCCWLKNHKNKILDHLMWCKTVLNCNLRLSNTCYSNRVQGSNRVFFFNLQVWINLMEVTDKRTPLKLWKHSAF